MLSPRPAIDYLIRMSPPRRDWLALLFCMIFPSLMSWLEFWVLPGGGRHNPALQAVFGLGKIVQFAFPLLYVWWTAREKLGWAKPTGRGLGWAVGFALATAGGMFGLYFWWLRDLELMARTGANIRQWLSEFFAAGPEAFLAMALFLAVIHSFLEEYYWRWFVFGWLEKQVPRPVALVVSSLAFMSHHVVVLAFYLPGHFWSAVVPFSLGVAAGGGFWAWLYRRSDNLYAPWLSHLLVDAAIMVVGHDMLVRAG